MGALSGMFSGVGEAAHNYFTGGTTAQSAGELAAQEFSSSQAQIERDFNANQAQLARDFSAKEAEKARQWEKMMSDTAISRAISDAKSAGINPYAVYTSVGSASSPSSPTGSPTSASASSGARGVYSGVRSTSDIGLINDVISVASRLGSLNSSKNVARSTKSDLDIISTAVKVLSKMIT